MFHRTLICGLLASVALFGLPGMTRACAAPCGNPCGNPCAPATTACAPTMTTVTVYEQVPETYTATRTVYKSVCVNETYTAYRSVCVQEARQMTKYVSRTIQEVKNVTVNRVTCVPTTVMKTVTKRVPVCKTVTTISRKCVDQGCYQTVCEETWLSKMKGKHNPCGHCPSFRSHKVWVPNKVWIETPCTKTVRSYECVTECVPVTVMNRVCVPEVKQVTCCRTVCEPVVTTCMVNVTKCVPYTATRQVTKCVPTCETYQACRMVCKAVTKQVACYPAPAASCCDSGCGCGSKRLFSGFGGFGGLFKGARGHGTSCGCGCN